MKKILALVCSILLFIALVPDVYADSPGGGRVIAYSETELDTGITMIKEIIEYAAPRSTSKTYECRETFYVSNTLIAEIAFEATFSYDGSSVKVLSKSVTQTDTYDGWSYKQNSFTSSGGTVTLDAALTKLLIYSQPFTMSMSCDENGNISY